MDVAVTGWKTLLRLCPCAITVFARAFNRGSPRR